MGCFHTFKLSNKEEPEDILENKSNVEHMLKNLTSLSTEENYFESQLHKLIEEHLCAHKAAVAGNWPVQSD
jgi:hypothetical protein